MDNCIDAGSTKIHIKLVNGGIDLIEISDNGIGIPSENLPNIFDAHTTSKISKIEDLNDLLSMGFRGEALSTITSVAKVSVVSKYEEEEFANNIEIEGTEKSEIKKAAREGGTVIAVKDLFFNIPARKKYLKTAQTEYRKIYEVLTYFFLEYPNIHFVLEKDGKVVEDLPLVKNSQAGEITKERISEILGKDFAEHCVETKYSGNGIDIQGYIAHPSLHKSRGVKNFIFINNRGIQDKGIFRAVYEGYARYLPFGQKVPFVLNIKIKPELVDVNVHPRKEEVRFQNPYRIYSAVENAIKHSLEKELSFRSEETSNFEEIRNRFKKNIPTNNSEESHGKSYIQRDLNFKPVSSVSVRDSLNFSRELLTENDSIPKERLAESSDTEFVEGEVINIFQIFNKYIVIEFANENLWIMDQHAVAERINFERLQNTHKKQDTQNLLVPTEIEMSKEEILFVMEFKKFFAELGFDISESKNGVSINSTPVEFASSNFVNMFKEIFEITEDIESLKKNFTKLREDILATMSCHSSIRSGQPLSRSEMFSMYNQLKECKNPYSCPHGRPAVWRMSLDEIDSNFERTY